jgi:hypothetical protein
VNARDQIILNIGLSSLATLVVIIGVAALVSAAADRIRNRDDDGDMLGAGHSQQRRELAEMRAARTVEIHHRGVNVEQLSEAERERRAQWRAHIDAEISEVNERFAKLTEELDDPIVWTVDVSLQALNAATAKETRRLGPPAPRKVLEWATGDLDLGAASWHRKRPRGLPSLAKVLRETESAELEAAGRRR